MDRNPFCRYRIEGTLTTRSPLHVGSGMEREMRIGGVDIRVMAVAADVNGRVYLPATTLKGRLHQWADQSEANRARVRELFGTGEPGQEVGGRLLFQDALLRTDPGIHQMPPLFLPDRSPAGAPLLCWDASRFTLVMASTALNRVTRTAERNKLYHYEVVPFGTAFKVVICGEALTDEEMALLLEALEQFNHPNGLSLGGFVSHGFGAMSWRLDKITGLKTAGQLTGWLDGSSVGYEGFPDLTEETLNQFGQIRRETGPNLTPRSATLTLEVEIDFEGPFMINDPSQCYAADGDQPGGLSHAYLKDDRGKVVLTAKSLHGALRAQAERIVRTIARDDVLKKACYIDSRDAACPPITQKDQLKGLCLTCRLFGGNGWRSPLTLSDFSPVADGEGEAVDQEFVAIDRFTGGAAEGKKFNARYRFRPTLAGQLKIDPSRIEARHAGLLILTLRDLIEGDIPLGFGRGKGFGACRARIPKVTLPDLYPPWLEENPFLPPENRDDLASTHLPLSDEQAMILQTLVETFVGEVNSHAVS